MFSLPHTTTARLTSVLLLSLAFRSCSAAEPVSVTVPATAPSHNVVQSNFLGISFELSFMDEYFGNDTSTIPPTIINYLAAIRARTGKNPVRIRVGGNSMDSSTYVPTQTSPMVQLSNTAPNANNQPVDYGPMLWDVLKKVADDVGGAEYLVGLSLLDPNNPSVPIIAADAQKALGDSLDGFLLGNEPDLYTGHHNRPNIANYTLDLYIDEFRTVSNRLADTSAGNLLNLRNIGGPTICCAWNLDNVLTDGYLAAFDNILKYVSVQHYPQNNCFGRHAYEIPYYLQHSNVVRLAAWQQPAIDIVISNTSSVAPKFLMSEFNSASCGGIPGISETYAVGSIWTVDYALQMAAVGYTAAFIHTRERGITYNLFTPPEGEDGNSGPWETNPPYYAVLATAEALQSTDGSIVVDLDIGNSKTDKNSPVGGYAIYDSKGENVLQFALFNFANASTETQSFTLPASAFASSGNKQSVTVKYLSAQDLRQENNIAWGGESLAGVGDGKLKADSSTWAAPNQSIDCSNGCSIDVPPVALAIVFVSGATKINTSQAPGSSTSNNNGNNNGNNTGNNSAGNSAGRMSPFANSLIFILWTVGAFYLAAM
ncbi:Beta-glucuronidase [Hypsizygus marmoreus]|uniref:Beta-glucuronidase n=1 Tax=Hypsizygus marmoreus TaxID=39966 RepID=A0A369JUW8_HYPMA|nr:Beta-glucuronidase [Hypsizygus marmoreus]